MKDILLTLAETTVSISFLIVLLLVLFRFFGKYLKSSCKYIIWLVVIVRLAVPFFGFSISPLMEFSLPFASSDEAVTIEKAPDNNGEADNGASVPVEEINGENNSYNSEDNSYLDDKHNNPNADVGNQTPTLDGVSAPATSDNGDPFEKASLLSEDVLVFCVFAVWLSGAVILFGVNAVKYIDFSRCLRVSSITPDHAVYDIYSSLCSEMKLKKAPCLLVQNGVFGPVMFGYLKPVIVLPASVIEEGDECIRNVLAHELVHYARKDLWLKLIAIVANSFNWFNPFVYAAVKRMNAEMELSCDEAVLRNYDEADRISYGKTLLLIADKSKKAKINLSTSFDPKKTAIGTRIANILDSSQKSRGKVLIIFVITVCVTVGLIFGLSPNNGGKNMGDSEETAVETESTVDNTVEETKDSPETGYVPETNDETGETSPETTFETEKEDEKIPDVSEFAEVINEKYDNYLDSHHSIYLKNTSGTADFSFSKLCLDYSYSAENRKVRKLMTLLLPQGYSDGRIFFVDNPENNNQAFVYAAANKDGQTYCFEYVFDKRTDSPYPISRNNVDQGFFNDLLKKSNSFPDKVYHGGDAYRNEQTYGEYELYVPITLTDYSVDARVVYCEDEDALENITLICACGYATVYPLKECGMYGAADGVKYETHRFKWGRVNDPDIPESYYSQLEENNKRCFIYMMKLKENYYIYISFYYKDRFNPPENAELDALEILKGVEAKIIQ